MVINMRLIFIRHGDPNYENDTLTEKGIREAELLSERAKLWNVRDFYCSPLGRAQQTASYTLNKTGRQARTLDWLKEFVYPITDPVTGRFGVPWDLMPAYWTPEPLYYDRENWFDTPLYLTNPEIKSSYLDVCGNLDLFLASYGYHRKGNFYECEPSTENDGEDTLVFFCHLGITLVILSHLLNIAPPLLWHGFFLAPTSVTVLNAEKRMKPGAYFRVQVIGDTAHLTAGNEPLSLRGSFADVFNG